VHPGRRIFLKVAVGFGVAAIVSLGILIFATRQPNDKQLERIFRKHKATLETLRAMAEKDSFHGFCAKGAYRDLSTRQLGESRILEYVRLLESMGASCIFPNDDNETGSISITMWAMGMPGTEVSAGFRFYPRTTPDGVYPCTDHL
jgi:hypothetical protein